jgi:hypothetical protein
MRALGSLFVLAIGCAGSPAGSVRFRNTSPVWLVNDRVDVDKSPDERDYNRTLYHADGYAFRRATRAMDMKASVRAQDVNSLDEVPDSTWFTNRIGVRDMTIEELRRGPNVDESPAKHLPWKITGAKIGGKSLGFIFEDARGEKYLLKFDTKGLPELETGAHIVGHRIVWAAGYNVPQDYLATIRTEDLVIAPDATKKDIHGNKTKITQGDLEKALSLVEHNEDGTIRVLASKYLSGPPIGPYAREGKRGDDPNDLIPHEKRRSVRGQYAIFSWLNHTDMQEDNTLDAYVADPHDKDRHYVMHYLIDFGKALGVMGKTNRLQTVGYTYRLDLGDSLKQVFGFGLVKRPWEDIKEPGLRGIGLFEAEHFDPGEWTASSMYWPYEDKDRFDAFWGAKILMRFTREQLAAIVDEAQYADPASAKYMVDTLVARQRKVGRYWFDKVAPLDGFTVKKHGDGARLCFTDLMLSYQLADVAAGTRYHVDAFDHDGGKLGDARIVKGAADGAVCTPAFAQGASNDGYTIVRLRVSRSARMLPPVLVHIANDANGEPRVIGLRRE